MTEQQENLSDEETQRIAAEIRLPAMILRLKLGRYLFCYLEKFKDRLPIDFENVSLLCHQIQNYIDGLGSARLISQKERDILFRRISDIEDSYNIEICAMYQENERLKAEIEDLKKFIV